MKLQRVLLSIICVVAVLLAISVSAFAINFKAEEKYNSVFVVTSGNALGSGFAIGENCVVTNAHVLNDTNNIELTTYSGEKYSAFLVGIDQDKDIAVLGVEDASFTPLKVVDYKTLEIGDDVYTIGAPKSMAYTLTKGVISAKDRPVGGYTYIQTDAAINEGNSGGPLVDADGNAIGINTLKMSDSEGIGLAIPMTNVCEFVKSLGVKTDENGNVTEKVVRSSNNAQVAPTVPFGGGYQIPDVFTRSPIVAIPFVFIFLGSVALNIVLLVLLKKQKRKTLAAQNYDPRERTDFDIDILE